MSGSGKKVTQSTEKLTAKKREMPATVGLVMEVRDELKADIRRVEHQIGASEKRLMATIEGVRSEMRSIAEGMRSEQGEIRSTIEGIRSEQHEMRSTIEGIRSDYHQILAVVEDTRSSVHRMQALYEQQYSENRIMLEKLSLMSDRQDRLEERQNLNDAVIKKLAQLGFKSLT